MAFAEEYSPAPVFAGLGEGFADAVAPADFPAATERFWNDRWAEAVGLGALPPQDRAAHFARFDPLPGNQAAPLAMRYHGHQFRVYNPQLGDGRGFLFGQVRDERDRLLDFGTKGSGQTPWSRQGDGRLTLKGAVREVLAAQMLEALGVYTSKPFAVFETGEALHRHDEPSPARSAVLTRLSHSHIRFGSFQRQAYEGEPDRILALAEHAIAAYYPDLAGSDDPGAALLDRVVSENARLAASWMAAGFVHGVLNTDNLNVTGESFDYGPWRFLPQYQPGFTAAYFDENGLYAYARQPEAVFWALQQFAGALSLASDNGPLQDALSAYPDRYRAALPAAFLARLGLASRGVEADETLVRDLLHFLHESQAPWEGVFFDWFCGAASADRAMKSPRAGHYNGAAFEAFRASLGGYEAVRIERLDDPYFRLDAPVAMTIDAVEGLWADIAENDDWTAFHAALDAIAAARRGFDLGRDTDGGFRPGFRGG